MSDYSPDLGALHFAYLGRLPNCRDYPPLLGTRPLGEGEQREDNDHHEIEEEERKRPEAHGPNSIFLESPETCLQCKSETES